MESTKPKKSEALDGVARKKEEILESIRPQGSGPDGESDFWQESVRKLEGLEFQSIDDAIEAIVDESLSRLGTVAPKGEEARNFLIDTFAFDEDLQSEIRKVLTIKDGLS